MANKPRVCADGLTAKVVFLTMHPDITYLNRAIDTVPRGDTCISPHLSSDSVTELLDPNVLQLLAAGKPSKEIGTILDIFARTVETHKYKTMDSLGLKTTAEHIQHAMKHGLAHSE